MDPSAQKNEIPIDVDHGPIPAAAHAVLPQLQLLYGDWFRIDPKELRVELVTDPEHWPAYDHFDQARNRVRMGWDLDAEQASILTLAHELVHAYEWAFDPVAYEQEPSWIHEGLAEQGVCLYLRTLDAKREAAYLKQTASAFLEAGHSFSTVFKDVYGWPYTEVYPACLPAVRSLLDEPDGQQKLLTYFRQHGAGRPARALNSVFGIRPAGLDEKVEALARRLLEERR